jgi:hypothetical protein
LRGDFLEEVTSGGRDWCPIQYEFLPNFCYGCGLLGHVYKECDASVGKEEDQQYGDWMRASPVRKKGFADSRGRWSGGVGLGGSHQVQSPKQIGDSTEKDLAKQKTISKKGSSWIAPDLHLEESNMTFEKMGQEALPDEGKEVSLVLDGDMWTEGARKNRGDVGLLILTKGEVGEQRMEIDGALQGVGGIDSNRQQRAEFQQGGESQDDELNEEQGRRISKKIYAELCGESDMGEA